MVRGPYRRIRRRTPFWRLVTAVPLLAAGCSDAGTGPTGDGGDGALDPSRTATATPAGGRLDFLGGAVTMELPAGAVSGNVTITVDSIRSGIPASAVPGGVFRFTPDGLSFDQPVILTVGYPEDRIPENFDREALRLHDYTSGSPILLLGSLQNVADATVSAEIHGFSDYGAGQASTENVVDAINDLFSQLEEGKVELLERYREGLARDIALTAPTLEADCVRTHILAQKLPLLAQLAEFELIKAQYGIGEPVPIESLCGGLMDGSRSRLTIAPRTPWMRPGSTEKFTAIMYGPGDQVLEGPIRWTTDPLAVLAVDPVTGLASALEPGNAELIALSPELPDVFFGNQSILVFDSLEVTVDPSPVVVGYDGSREVRAVILSTTTGEEQPGALPIFESLDTDVADFSAAGGLDPGVVQVRGRAVGSTRLRVCARLAGGVDTGFCALPVVDVIPSVAGSWTFNDVMEVEVDPPASETCASQGTAQIEQVGDTYSGSTNATIVCTHDPGNGSAPEVTQVVVQGNLRNGTLTGTGFYHEVFYPNEACRASGTLVQGTEFTANLFVSGSGETECLDYVGYYSVGPITLRRPGG